MKIRTTFALAAATLTLGVPVAAADPGGYESDAFDRYAANNGPDGLAGQPDAFARFLRNHPNGAESALDSTSAARHPDSLAVRPGVVAAVDRAENVGPSWEIVALGAFGGALLVLLGVAGASTMRERRRLVLR